LAPSGAPWVGQVPGWETAWGAAIHVWRPQLGSAVPAPGQRLDCGTS